MTRVLHVLNEVRSSGAEVALRNAIDLWHREGIDCDVLATGADVGPFAPDLAAAGFTIHHYPLSRPPWFFRQYIQLLRSGNYDVVHVQLERASFYLCVIARIMGKVVIRTVRNAYPFEGRLAHKRQLQRRVARAVGTRFVAISASVAENELKRFRNPTRQINNWIDVARFRPPTLGERSTARERLRVPDGAIVMATVGNCSAIKNHSSLLHALAARAEYNWIWLHVGSEEKGEPEREVARALGVEDRCRFLGRTDPLEALHAADAFSMPSLWEGLGMATVEAFSTGLPALLTDVAGNRDFRHLPLTIYWSEPDSNSLAEALMRCFAALQGAGINRLGSHVEDQHNVIAAEYSPDNGASKYVSLYRGAEI